MKFVHITFSEYMNTYQELFMVVNDPMNKIHKVFWENLNGKLFQAVNKHFR